jgi:iron complex outermembrane receptor protein
VIGFSSTTVYPEIFDLQRVEILRGPQGTLFGAGSEGGTVRFITPQPSLTQSSFYGRSELAATRGGEPSFELGIAGGGPLINDVLGLRASAFYRRDGGYVDRRDRFDRSLIDRNSNWKDTVVGKVALALEPVNGLRITPSIYYQRLFINDSSFYWEYLTDLGRGDLVNGAPVSAGFKGTTILPALNVAYEGRGFTIVSNTSYLDQKNVSNRDLSELLPTLLGVSLSPTHPVPGYPDYKIQDLFINTQKVFTQEVRFQSTGRKVFNWVIGVFYQDSRQRSSQYLPETQASISKLTDVVFGATPEQVFGVGLVDGLYSYRSIIDGIDKQTAVFGEGSLKLFRRLTLTAGVRLAKTSFSFNNKTDGPYNGGSSLVNGNQAEKPVTPKFSVSFDIDDSNLVYATAAKGYRVGGANSAIPTRCGVDLTSLGYKQAPNSYNSDTVQSYELGSKNRLFRGKVRIASSIYQIKWSGIQQSVDLPSCGLNFVANLGSATSKGFDLQADIAPTRGLTLGIALGYNKATYDQSLLSPPNPVTGIRPVVVAKGDSLGNAPFTLSATAQYDFVVHSREAYLRGEYAYSSRQTIPTPSQDSTTSAFNPSDTKRPETNLVTARLGVKVDKVDLSLFGDNILDSRPQLSRGGSTLNTIYTNLTFRPRTIGVTGAVRF